MFALFENKVLKKVNELTSFIGYTNTSSSLANENANFNFGLNAFEVYKILYDKHFINSVNYNLKYSKKLNNYMVELFELGETTIINVNKIIVDGDRVYLIGELCSKKECERISSVDFINESLFVCQKSSEIVVRELMGQKCNVISVSGDKCVILQTT